MPAFGNSAEMNQSREMLNGIPPRYWDIFEQLMNQAQGMGIQGDALRQWFIGELQRRGEAGIGQPETISGVGQQIAPFNETIEQRRDRLANIYNTNPDVSGTAGELNTNIDQYGQTLGSRAAQVEDITNSGFGRMSGRANAATGDIVGSIRDSYGAGGTNFNNAYSDLLTNLNPAFGRAESNVAMLKPGGDFAAARTARAFAPMMADTNRRLRASGVDPNSPQAIAALQNVSAKRSRAMDDAAAGGNETYVRAANDLLMSRLGMQTGLGREQANTNLNTTLAQGRDFRSELARALGVDLGIEEGQMSANTANVNRSADLAKQYMDARNQAALTGRQLTLDDWLRTSNLAREMNAEDLQGLQLRIQQYNTGLGHTLQDQQVRNTAGDQIGQLAQQEQQNQIALTGAANPFGAAAYNGFNQTYGREAQNSNSLLRPILGAVSAGMNLFAPGSGSLIPQVPGGGGGGGFQLPNLWSSPNGGGGSSTSTGSGSITWNPYPSGSPEAGAWGKSAPDYGTKPMQADPAMDGQPVQKAATQPLQKSYPQQPNTQTTVRNNGMNPTNMFRQLQRRSRPAYAA